MIFERKRPCRYEMIIWHEASNRNNVGEFKIHRPKLSVKFEGKPFPQIDTEAVAKAYTEMEFQLGIRIKDDIKGRIRAVEKEIIDFIQRSPEFGVGQIYVPLSRKELVDRFAPHACPVCDVENLPGRNGLKEHMEKEHPATMPPVHAKKSDEIRP